MSAALIKCHICLEFKGTLEFKFFPCGHGFCGSPCINELFSHSTLHSPVLCPECRSRLRRGDARPIYFELATYQDEQAVATKRLVNSLTRIDRDSKAISVEIVEKRLEKLTKTSDRNDSNMVILLEAVMEFKERIVPVFRRAEEQSQEIERLKEQLSKHGSEVAANARQIETLERKRDEACDLWQKTIAERDKAIDLSNQAVLKIKQLQKDLARIRAQETRLEDTKILYKAQLLDHKEMEQKQNEKIKSLKRQLIIAQQEVQKERDAQIKVDPSVPSSQCLKRRATSSCMPSQTPVELIDATSESTLFEAMPKPDQFGSDWRFTRPDLKKQKVVDTFPVKLDKRGHAVGPIQSGSRKTIRIKR